MRLENNIFLGFVIFFFFEESFFNWKDAKKSWRIKIPGDIKELLHRFKLVNMYVHNSN